MIVDKILIEKILTDVISIKCGRNTLTSSDKEFIANFYENKDNYQDDLELDTPENFDKHRLVQVYHDYSLEQATAVSMWGHTLFQLINGRIYNTELYQEGMELGAINEKEVINQTKILQSAIDNGPRIPHDVVVHRIGYWDEGLSEGDVVVQKGFASTSYTAPIGVANPIRDGGYEITYYVSTGTKGVLVNSEQFDVYDENELLLGRNTRQYILNQDDVNHTVEVLVLPDR